MESLPSPCIGLCSTMYGDPVCRGCKRFSYEVAGWNGFNEEQRKLIDKRLENMLLKILDDTFKVLDTNLLETFLQEKKVKYRAHRQPVCWVFEALTQKKLTTEEFSSVGVEVKADYHQLDAKELHRLLDKRWFGLATTYFKQRICVKKKSSLV